MLTTLVIKINGDGFSRKFIFKDYLGLSVAEVRRSHRNREGGLGVRKGSGGRQSFIDFLFFITPVILLMCFVYVTVFHLSPLSPLCYDLKFVFNMNFISFQCRSSMDQFAQGVQDWKS